MTPHLGTGAGMGIEVKESNCLDADIYQDASVFTRFLTSRYIFRSTVSFALKAYDSARVQKTGDVLVRARNQGRTYEYRTEGVGRDGSKIQSWTDENVRAIVGWSAEGDVERGLARIGTEIEKRGVGEVFQRAGSRIDSAGFVKSY